MGYYSFYKIIKDIFQTIFGRNFFRFLLIILITGLIILCLSSLSNKVSASNEGIMPLSVVDEYVKNEDGSYTYDYTYHGTDQVYTGSVIVPAEFYDDVTYPHWVLGILSDGRPAIMYSTKSELSTYLFTPYGSNSSSPSAYLNIDFESNVGVCLYATDSNYSYSDDDTNIAKYITYSDGTWSSANTAATFYSADFTFLPSGFLYSRNAEVFYTKAYMTTDSSFSSYKWLFNSYIKLGSLKQYPIRSTCFYGTTPYLIELSDTTYKLALGTCYDDYTFESEDDNFVDVTDTSINNLYINIVDNDGDDFVYSYTYSPLKSYIKQDEEYGMVLEIPLDDFIFLDQTFEFISGHTYTFSFQVDCTNTISKGNFSYSYYDTCNFSNELVYGSGSTVGGGTGDSDDTEGSGGGGTGDSDDAENTINNQISNSIDAQTNAINNLTNTITSNEYDESQIQLDSSLSNNVDENSYTNFITEIINAINNAITCDWNKVEIVQIPLGFVDKNITWESDLLSSHIPDSLKLIINTFWMFLFGFYIFKFSLSLVNWLKSGEILDGKGFNSNEVITSNML